MTGKLTENLLREVLEINGEQINKNDSEKKINGKHLESTAENED